MMNEIFNRLSPVPMVLMAIIVYLFVTAPPPLPEKKPAENAAIPIEKALEILNAENAKVRQIYTQEIVGDGKKAGLKFDEHWEDEDIIAAPLPAQFLRQTALGIENKRIKLGLYLGSDFAINRANQFTGEQLGMYRQIKKDNKPRFFYVADTQVYAYMFPDIAISRSCIKCHNDHKDSPKTDWKLKDVMGATTWIHTEKKITMKQLMEMIVALRQSVGEAYSVVLKELSLLKKPPVVGDQWPADGYYLPSLEVFMAKVNEQSSPETMTAITNISKIKNSDITRLKGDKHV